MKIKFTSAQVREKVFKTMDIRNFSDKGGENNESKEFICILAGMLSGSAFGRGVKSFHQLTGPTGVGALTLAINVERFMPLAQFRNLMKGYADSIRSSRKAKGTARIYLPGEIESEKEKMSRERGIELSAASSNAESTAGKGEEPDAALTRRGKQGGGFLGG